MAIAHFNESYTLSHYVVIICASIAVAASIFSRRYFFVEVQDGQKLARKILQHKTSQAGN